MRSLISLDLDQAGTCLTSKRSGADELEGVYVD